MPEYSVFHVQVDKCILIFKNSRAFMRPRSLYEMLRYVHPKGHAALSLLCC